MAHTHKNANGMLIHPEKERKPSRCSSRRHNTQREKEEGKKRKDGFFFSITEKTRRRESVPKAA